MRYMEKPIVLVLTKEKDPCPKCIRTKQIIKEIVEKFPDFGYRIDFAYRDIHDMEIIEKYGKLNAPAIMIKKKIFSEGLVPIADYLTDALKELVK